MPYINGKVASTVDTTNIPVVTCTTGTTSNCNIRFKNSSRIIWVLNGAFNIT